MVAREMCICRVLCLSVSLSQKDVTTTRGRPDSLSLSLSLSLFLSPSLARLPLRLHVCVSPSPPYSWTRKPFEPQPHPAGFFFPVCCNELQLVAVSCSVLQLFAPRPNPVEFSFSTALQQVVVCCIRLYRNHIPLILFPARCSELQ